MTATPARPSLLPIAALVSLLVVGLGVTGLFSLHYSKARAAADLARLEALNRAHLGAVHARADFKTQIQEWKNILLRGANPADLAAYRSGFEQQEAAVHTQLEELARALPLLQPAPPIDVADLLAEHARLGAAYRATLASFTPADPGAAQRADAAVRGLDRTLSAKLDAVSETFSRAVAAELQSNAAAAAGRYESMRQLVLIVATVAIVAALFLVFAANRAARA